MHQRFTLANKIFLRFRENVGGGEWSSIMQLA